VNLEVHKYYSAVQAAHLVDIGVAKPEETKELLGDNKTPQRTHSTIHEVDESKYDD